MDSGGVGFAGATALLGVDVRDGVSAGLAAVGWLGWAAVARIGVGSFCLPFSGSWLFLMRAFNSSICSWNFRNCSWVAWLVATCFMRSFSSGSVAARVASAWITGSALPLGEAAGASGRRGPGLSLLLVGAGPKLSSLRGEVSFGDAALPLRPPLASVSAGRVARLACRPLDEGGWFCGCMGFATLGGTGGREVVL